MVTTSPLQMSSVGSSGRGRRRLRAAVGALVLTGALGACSNAGPSDVAGRESTGTDAVDQVTVLTVPDAGPGAPAGLCAVLEPEHIADNDLAVQARVVDERDGIVVLEVVEDFAGGTGEQVQVPQGRADVPSEISPGVFRTGEEYLLTAVDGDVQACGASGPVTPELRAVYDAAFPTR